MRLSPGGHARVGAQHVLALHVCLEVLDPAAWAAVGVPAEARACSHPQTHPAPHLDLPLRLLTYAMKTPYHRFQPAASECTAIAILETVSDRLATDSQ